MYHWHSWFDPSNLPSTPERTYVGTGDLAIVKGPWSSIRGVGDPTFQGYQSDDDPSFPGPE